MSTSIHSIKAVLTKTSASKTGSKIQKNSLVKNFWKNKRKRRSFLYLILGLSLIVSGIWVGSGKTGETQQPIISDYETFASEPITVDSGLTKQTTDGASLKSPPTRIIIPSISLDVGVRVAPVVSGYWQVFEDSAGFGEGSAYPADVGNTVIFAHAREGLFLPLKSVKVGQMVYVMTDDTWYTYTVKEIKEVLPSQKEVIEPTTDATLTLYTCTGFADSKRLIVVAKRI